MESNLTPEFWDKLARMRSCSRLVLAALESDDVAEVERLAREAETALAELAPIIEARLTEPDGGEEADDLREMMRDLKAMNDRILDELASKAAETRREIGQIRENRLKLTHYRRLGAAEPSVLDRRT